MDLVKRILDGEHVRRMVVRYAARLGWDVSEEVDSQVLRAVHCEDWHRVERMLSVFELTARESDADSVER